ncbi:Beta-lactamase [Archangium gephyra]|uniref:Beta-lactamase n=1 Tax=Archangium gephyra TaxID=48 RepID=A0AAC8T9W5_9BACT|nr:Beta-lactamase [Archangium gephyra]
MMLPAEDVVIAIASNLEGEAKRQRRISTRIIETLLEDGLVRRDAHLVDPVDAVVHEGLARLFTYGLSYHLWATRGPGVLPEPGDLSEAFTRMSGLLDRATIAQDPQAALQRVRDAHQPREGSLLIRVGAHMALTLEKTLGPEKLREYPQRGALAFFTDYLAACEQVPCATPLRFSESLQKDARHFDDVWQRAQVSELRRVRLDEVKDAEALWPALELATANTSLHPDYVDEMVRVAGLLGKRGRKEEQLRWLERAVALHPQSAPAREALAKVQAPGTQETPEVPAATAPRRATDGSSPVPDDAGLLPASHPVPQRPQERAAEQGG